MEILKLLIQIFWAVLVAIARKVWPAPKKSIVGEIALVTGAAHGLGRGIALKLASLGAKVIVVDINEKGNNETAAQIRKAGGEAHSYKCDLSDKDSIKNLANAVRKDVGDVSILVNNAAVVFVTDLLSRTDDMTCTTFSVNCLAHFRLIKEFLPAMKEKNHGHVVAIASLAAYLAAPYLADYCATKAGIIAVMDSFRREMRWTGSTGIKGTCVSSSWINTGFAKNPQSGNQVLSPILQTDYVVERTIDALLREEEVVEIPSASGMFLIKALFPQKVVELCFDHVRPSCDRVDEKKEN